MIKTSMANETRGKCLVTSILALSTSMPLSNNECPSTIPSLTIK